MKTNEVIFNGMKVNGFLALFINLVVIPALAVLTIYYAGSLVVLIPVLVVLALAFFIMMAGYFSQEPNEARVMVFFGKY